MTEGNEKKEIKPSEINEAWWQPALLMFGRLSGWVIGPVVVGTFLGQWLDKKNNTEPWALLGCVGISFIISMVGLVRNALEEMKKVEDLKKELDTKK